LLPSAYYRPARRIPGKNPASGYRCALEQSPGLYGVKFTRDFYHLGVKKIFHERLKIEVSQTFPGNTRALVLV